MSVFDTIEGEQVKCFYRKFKYNVGDTVPCETFGYNNNVLIIPFDTSSRNDWENAKFIIIKDSKVFGFKRIHELSETDFTYIREVITCTGLTININNFDDLLEYIRDVEILQVYDLIKENNNKLFESFKRRW